MIIRFANVRLPLSRGAPGKMSALGSQLYIKQVLKSPSFMARLHESTKVQKVYLPMSLHYCLNAAAYWLKSCEFTRRCPHSCDAGWEGLRRERLLRAIHAQASACAYVAQLPTDQRRITIAHSESYLVSRPSIHDAATDDWRHSVSIFRT